MEAIGRPDAQTRALGRSDAPRRVGRARPATTNNKMTAPDAPAAPSPNPPSPAVLRRVLSAPQMEQRLRTALAMEQRRRIVAEKRANLVKTLSPLERFAMAAWAKLTLLLRLPAPRCLCCGGPLFWLVLLPWFVIYATTGASPLALVVDRGSGEVVVDVTG